VKRVALLSGNSDSFRIVHISIQGNHIHLLTEATDEHALAAGMQRFEILDPATDAQRSRLRAEQLGATSRGSDDTRRGDALIDPYSTAWAFDGWRDLDEVPEWDRLPSAEPRSWRLRVGWRKHALLGVREVPGPIGSTSPRRAHRH